MNKDTKFSLPLNKIVGSPRGLSPRGAANLNGTEAKSRAELMASQRTFRQGINLEDMPYGKREP